MNINLTPNFTLSEFNSKDGSAMPVDVRTNIEHLAEQLQVIRDHIGQPLTVTSGYRSPAHNKAVGGAPKSFHVQGKAVDLKARDMSAKELAATITALMIEGKIAKGGIGLYSTWVHYDTRGSHVRFR